ncbi:UvrD/REP helicase [Beutenbergia cavernae DSM 12333]|uniref:DNA 3'-5' helicase n=1 Tax=Beutenbergia cavernae (strain ATCC BAA-8 / DSM 12333 / CCUG 43141 / JCM 11478 / NBRC 16432 / NCIMB 13614 / HKI 0122) TaxID=471853 RepID=C5C3C8_BEUC1|nr:UvrD-helicase domain-containing protein [Beutenbergia cavernae]ACQ79827.1 UvrD/REP helicase [Beutenbergia cavernae DSM 12333]
MTLVDDAARSRIATDTSSSLFVEAGAGSGKTRSLVERVGTLVMDDGVPLAQIAAITFTEKAGAELRDRLRGEFERVWRRARPGGPQEDPARSSLAERALEDLDGAAIGTLHSFAQRILARHPVEAGLPPLIEVSDEVASGVAFDERWSVLQRELLDDEEMAPRLLLAMAAGVTFDHLRSLARAFGADWDLIEGHVLRGASNDSALPDAAPLVDEAQALAARAAECTDPDDKLLTRLSEIRAWAQVLAAADGDPRRTYAALVALGEPRFGRVGRKTSWPDVDAVRAACTALVEHVSAAAAAFADAAVRPLARWIAARVVRDARARAAEGALEFHDLLVLARDLLRTREDVRSSLQAAYPRLLLDEFQDTDPIQVELAVRIAAGAEGGAGDWHDVRVPPGSLFVVGDPKQSIYRFRRADIRTFLDVRTWLGDVCSLTTNFRSAAPVLAWVNATFGELIQPVDGAQPAYEPLDAVRPPVGVGPAVTVLGAQPHQDLPRASAALLREREAADVAAVLLRAAGQGWTVHDPRGGEERELRWGDVAVLVPARTSLPFLVEALDAAGIPYRAESSSLVYSATEVRALMAAARAIADPGDQFSVVTALRSQVYGCGDDDLWSWKRDGGSFHLLAPADEDRADHPVAQGLAHLRTVHRWARWATPSEVLARVAADRRMFEVPADAPAHARDVWRRLRFVLDQARAWSEVSHGGLRAYLAWAARQADESSRVAEAILPETDVDAVRIMTIHAAKGLEFPLVVLSGLTSQQRRASGVRLLWTDDGYAVRLRQSVQTNDFTAAAPLDEQMDDHERRRLLYVGATRARDHLVVSLHRGPTAAATHARLLADAGGSGAGAHAFTAADDGAARPERAAAPAAPDHAAWAGRLEAARAASRRVATHSASGLEGTEPEVVFAHSATGRANAGDAVVDPGGGEGDALPGSAKGPRDLALPPWSKGRYGTAIGRAVHGVLQAVDLRVQLADAGELDAAVEAQARVEGVLEFADVVADLALSALASPLVQDAARREHWAETFVATLEPDGRVLEGVVDLLVRDADGAVTIVDYKTDAVPEAALGVRTEFYAPQLRAYARALRDAGADVRRAVLLFLAPDGAVEREVTLGL